MRHTSHPSMKISRVAAVLFILTAPTLVPSQAISASATFSGIVMRVQDGDTISVSRGSSVEDVQLAGIDCPELRQSFGARARKFTERLASGQMVMVRAQGRDTNGNVLGVVILPDGRTLNRELVAAGLAWKLKESKNKSVAQLEKDARRAKRGLWSDANPTPPWDYRKARNAKR
jgi:endonuclease YncB( thermonuclease family)